MTTIKPTQPVNKLPKPRKENLELDELGRRRTLTPTGLAQYLSLDNCDRFLRFYLYKGETDKIARRLRENGLPQVVLQPFGPLMAKLGDRIETRVLDGLKAQGHVVLDLTDQDLQATVAAMRTVETEPVYLYQAQVSGQLGRWQFEGRADLIRVGRDSTGRLTVLVGDVKATRKDKVNHRLQVAVYVSMVQSMLAEAKLEVSEFLGAVIRRNPDGTLQDPASATPFDLDPYFSALDQLAIAPDSALAKVDAADPQDLHYYLNQKCDGCLFNRICMVESAERQDVGLVPFLESADKRALNEYGIKTVAELANLKTLPVRPSENQSGEVDRQLKVAPGKEQVVAALSEKWPVGPKLDRLVQRAARMLGRLDRTKNTTSYSFFFDAGRSILPDEKIYPELVKIFLDVQTDYLEDRVYLAGARIVGTNGTRSVVRMTPTIPDEASERALLLEWVAGIFEAVMALATDPEATPVHLYLYNRHDQKFLLDALRRHLDVFAAIPALYNLLTASPALSQSAVSFVYSEVKERRNLASTGHTLQAVATQLGFKWEDAPDLLYYRLFEQGMFDYLWRRSDGRYIESAARFYSSIPLEYAYGAWGMFRAEDFKPQQRANIAAYLKVTADQLQAFQAKRLEALAHIETNFKSKNAYIKKEPLNLARLAANAGTIPPFRKILEEFLYIEHYANLQAHLELFSQPIDKRVQQGRALLLRCTALEETTYKGKPAPLAHFEADFSNSGLEPAAALQLSKIKVGDWVVLNSIEIDGRPWEIVRGRLGIVRSLEGARLAIDLSNMTAPAAKNQLIPFRYYHDNKLAPQPGQFYTVDEMVDDLNGDKLLDGCRNADFNPFYQLIAADNFVPEISNQRGFLPEDLTAKAVQFADWLAQMEGQNAPTPNQREVIAGHLNEKLFLVQGPPGTGKSHTIGWAVLARMFAERAAYGSTLRVAVSCQTHNAVNIVLQSIAAKLRRLKIEKTWPWLASVHLFKLGEEDNVNTVAGVEALDPWQQRLQIAQILNSQLVVIGGTPGGLYGLMKRKHHNSRVPEALWQEKPFDLVILDEASQMNLPQALLATSWLREEGQLIVVGDHRQMAPILVHGWDEEARLSSMTSKPYRSVFQYLVDQNFPRVALDESFRLHQVQAEFLQQNIYRQDNINFFSRRQKLLPAINNPDLSPYLKAVLDPAYTVIVVEHGEHNSQQANLTEVNLITPLVEFCTQQLGLGGAQGIGVVVPHRAQKALLREHLPMLAASDAIDTVERFQGDEREVIIVSATASDPDYVLAEAQFLLNPNRLNVALSRPKKKLIVVASSVVFKFLSADLEIFDQAVLWKRLISQCADEVLWSGIYANTTVRVLGRKA